MRRIFVTGVCLAALILVAVAGYLVLGNNERGSSLYTGPASNPAVVVSPGAVEPTTGLRLVEATPADLPPETRRLGPTMEITATSAVDPSTPVIVNLPYDTRAARPAGMAPLVLIEQDGAWSALEPKEDPKAGLLSVHLALGELEHFDLPAVGRAFGIPGVKLTPVTAKITKRETEHFVVRYTMNDPRVGDLESQMEDLYRHFRSLGFRDPDLETDSAASGSQGAKFVVRVNEWDPGTPLGAIFGHVDRRLVAGSYDSGNRRITLNRRGDTENPASEVFGTTLPHEYFHAIQYAYELRTYDKGWTNGGEPPFWLWLVEPTAATVGATYKGGSGPQRDDDKPVMPLETRLTRLSDPGRERYALQDFFVYVARAGGAKNSGYLLRLFQCVPGLPSVVDRIRAALPGNAPSPTSLECLDRMVNSLGLSGLPDAYASFVRSGYLRMRGNPDVLNAYSRDGAPERVIDGEVSRLLTPVPLAIVDFSLELEQWQTRLLRVQPRASGASEVLRLSVKDGKAVRAWAWALSEGDKAHTGSEATLRDGVLEVPLGEDSRTVEVLFANPSNNRVRVGGAFSVAPAIGKPRPSSPETKPDSSVTGPLPKPAPLPVQARALLAESIAAMRRQQKIEVRSKADLLAMSSSSHVVLNLPDNVDGEGDAAGIAWSATSAQGRTQLTVNGQMLAAAPSKGIATQVRDAILSIPVYGSDWTVRSEKGSYRLESRVSTDGLDTILRGTGVQIPGNPKAKMVLTIDPGAKLWQTLDLVLLWPVVDYTLLGREIELGPAATTSLDFGNRTAAPASVGGQVLGASASDDERELAKSTAEGAVEGLKQVQVLKPVAETAGVVFAILDLRQAVTMLGEEPKERAALQAARQRYGENSLQYDDALRRYRDWEYRMPLVGPFLRFILPRPVSSR